MFSGFTSSRIYAMTMIFSLVMMGYSSHVMQNFPRKRMVPLNELQVSDNLIQDIGFLTLGSRRLAADIAYIQFLQYYGVEIHHHHDDQNERHEDPTKAKEFDIRFPLIRDYGFRILRLHPFFNVVILELSGALAFNEKRIDESLSLLKEAIERDPTYYRYHLYVAAILYKNQGQDDQLIQKLDEAAQYRDCPPILLNVLANLYKKQGRDDKAAKIYLKIIDLGIYRAESDHAEKELRILFEKNPQLRLTFGLPSR